MVAVSVLCDRINDNGSFGVERLNVLDHRVGDREGFREVDGGGEVDRIGDRDGVSEVENEAVVVRNAVVEDVHVTVVGVDVDNHGAVGDRERVAEEFGELSGGTVGFGESDRIIELDGVVLADGVKKSGDLDEVEGPGVYDAFRNREDVGVVRGNSLDQGLIEFVGIGLVAIGAVRDAFRNGEAVKEGSRGDAVGLGIQDQVDFREGGLVVSLGDGVNQVETAAREQVSQEQLEGVIFVEVINQDVDVSKVGVNINDVAIDQGDRAGQVAIHINGYRAVGYREDVREAGGEHKGDAVVEDQDVAQVVGGSLGDGVADRDVIGLVAVDALRNGVKQDDGVVENVVGSLAEEVNDGHGVGLVIACGVVEAVGDRVGVGQGRHGVVVVEVSQGEAVGISRIVGAVFAEGVEDVDGVVVVADDGLRDAIEQGDEVAEVVNRSEVDRVGDRKGVSEFQNRAFEQGVVDADGFNDIVRGRVRVSQEDFDEVVVVNTGSEGVAVDNGERIRQDGVDVNHQGIDQGENVVLVRDRALGDAVIENVGFGFGVVGVLGDRFGNGEAVGQGGDEAAVVAEVIKDVEGVHKVGADVNHEGISNREGVAQVEDEGGD